MKIAVPLLLLLLFSVASNMAAQMTTYTIEPGSTSNSANHLYNCPSQIASVNGQATNSPDGGICFLAIDTGGDYLNPGSPSCTGPNNSHGQCFSLYAFLNQYGGNDFTDGCVYDSGTDQCTALPAPVVTYCAAPTATLACGVGSTYTETFDYWFPEVEYAQTLSSQFIGTLTINLETNDVFLVCPRYRGCHSVANNVITGGSGSVMPK